MSLSNLPCAELQGVGKKINELLKKRGIHTVYDLLFHFPSRYQDRTRILPIADLLPDISALIEGEVIKTSVTFGRKRGMLCRIADASGEINLRFFHFNMAQQKQLAAGTRVRCFGDVKQAPRGRQLMMIHPEYQILADDQIVLVDATLTPIYPTTEGLTQNRLRKMIQQVLSLLAKETSLNELLPVAVLQQYELMPLRDALVCLHAPPPEANTELLLAGKHPAQQRLVFEELLAHHAALRRMREYMQSQQALRLVGDNNSALLGEFIAALPFSLTSAQQRVLDEMLTDIAQTRPMLRLVQGDVGSGKTVIAALGVLQAVASGHQAALMAPTELLAEQHYRQFKQWLAPLGVEVAWLSGSVGAAQRRETLAIISSGQAQVVIGTHALFQESVKFNQLAFVVIDEQHRFGVEQRLALWEKGHQAGCVAHQLVMTATPIPRTLAITAFADLDYSVIDELPPGRKPVTTVALSNQRRDEVLQRVKEVVVQGRQVYWVCTLVEESDVLQCQAAEVAAEQLQQELQGLRVGLVHGRMSSADKDLVMSAFVRGDIDLLVATTVIEVGVNVPNASLMIIENPERLGLAQLHQLRGRVGRGVAQSYCVLLYQSPLTQTAKERIALMRETNDGFKIAEADLHQRGPGEVLGARQTGLVDLRVADLVRDQYLIPKVQEAAQLLLADYDECVEPLIAHWLGDKAVYIDANTM